jgi:hypothetical protein
VNQRLRTALLAAGGVLIEAGCLWVWQESPRLTAIYNADYTRALFDALPWLVPLADTDSSVAALDMATRLIAGLVVMSAGYVLALAVVRVNTTLVVGFAALFRVTLALLPGLYSTDVFSYVMYGRIAGVHGNNPYVAPPASFGADSFLAWVFPFWRDQPSVYGPLWTDFSGLLSQATRDWSPLGQTLAYRTGVIGLEAVVLALLWWLLRGRTREWLVYAWNPLVLFDLVGATHNDVAMLALMLVGFAFVLHGRWLAGLVALALSALVKYATALVVMVVAVAWAASGGRRALRLCVGLGVPLVLAGAFWWPWLGGGDALQVLGAAAGGRLVLNSAPDLLALTVADWLAIPPEAARADVRWLSRGVFAIYLVWELWRVWRSDGDVTEVLKSSTRLLLVLPLLVMTWVWSWYFSWSLVPAVLVGWRWLGTRLVVAYSLVALPVVYAHQYLNEQLAGVWVLVMALAPLVVLMPIPIRRGPAARTSPE